MRIQPRKGGGDFLSSSGGVGAAYLSSCCQALIPKEKPPACGWLESNGVGLCDKKTEGKFCWRRVIILPKSVRSIGAGSTFAQETDSSRSMGKYMAVLIAVVLMGTACEPSAQNQAKTLHEEVMALHDSSMAKMGDLYTHRKELLRLQDSLPAADSARQRGVRYGVSKLLEADEHMMQWMRAYRIPDLQKPKEALLYLQDEREKIQKVRQEIEQSLKVADSLAAQLTNKHP